MYINGGTWGRGGGGGGGRITGRDDQSHQQHIDSPRCVYAAFFVHKNECHYSNTK